MKDAKLADLARNIAELNLRADKAQASAFETFGRMFAQNDRKPPEDFVESSYLWMRSCDADQGFRPLPCPDFWLSPDLQAVPLSGMGVPTRTLVAGDAYRLTATLRNRGDLAVPAAKVEFWLVNPSLGFDTRFATKLGVAQNRIEAHGAAPVALDWTVPPALAGHYCLFARAFSFAPLDIPVSDTALDPRIDRHVAQLNLNFVAPAQAMILDWVHHRNAREMLMLAPMPLARHQALRHELLSPLRLLDARATAELARQVKFEVVPERVKGVETVIEETREGLVLHSRDDSAVPVGQQLELTKAVMSLMGPRGRLAAAEHRKLLADYRRMTAQTLRSRVRLHLPGAEMKPGEAAAFQILRRDEATGEITGGVALYLAP